MKWLKSTPFNQKEEQQRVGRRETKEFQHICSQMICLHYRQRIKDYIDENCKEKPFLRVHNLENAKKTDLFQRFHSSKRKDGNVEEYNKKEILSQQQIHLKKQKAIALDKHQLY